MMAEAARARLEELRQVQRGDPLRFGAAADAARAAAQEAVLAGGAVEGLEDLMWRYCYYKRIEALRAVVRHQEQPQRQAVGQLLHFLDSARAQYEAFLARLREVAAVAPARAGALRRSEHRCLLYLGDLTRYRELHEPGKDKTFQVAEDYYRRAFAADPQSGNPHNQLAVLAQGKQRLCQALYHYVRSLRTARPFPQAKSNLALLNKKLAKISLPAPDEPEPPVPPVMTSSQRSELLRGFLARFGALHGSLAKGDPEETAGRRRVVERIPRELPVLLRKWALAAELQMALVVCSIHAVLVAAEQGDRSVLDDAWLGAFAVGAAFAGMLGSAPGGEAERPLARPDLLAPTTVFLEWLRESPLAERARLAEASVLWSAFGPVWNTLLSVALKARGERTTDRAALWEERELAGFLPVWPEGRPAPRLSENLAEDSPAATAVRALKVCSFFDWLGNSAGLRCQLPFEPPLLEPGPRAPGEGEEDTEMGSAALSTAAMLLGEADNDDGNDDDDDDDEVIVLEPGVF